MNFGVNCRKDSKSMSQTKTTRLNALYERLKGANGISIKDLAAEFEVSAKMIQQIQDFAKVCGVKNSL